MNGNIKSCLIFPVQSRTSTPCLVPCACNANCQRKFIPTTECEFSRAPKVNQICQLNALCGSDKGVRGAGGQMAIKLGKGHGMWQTNKESRTN